MKEKIILATLDLASKYGLGSLSMSQIAEAVGIKKPSLYNHFSSKDELINETYNYIREQSKGESPAQVDLSKDAEGVLSSAVDNYLRIVENERMLSFYKVIYSERSINPAAAQILVDETNKMVVATRMIMEYLNQSGKMHIDNIDMAAMSFALSIHALIDFRLDSEMAGEAVSPNLFKSYIYWFCEHYK